MPKPVPQPPQPASPKRLAWLDWIDERLPIRAFWARHFTAYRVPHNLNIWYVFGSLAVLSLVIQFVSGLFLTMHYKPDARFAFESVERIMREVRWGWLIRYVHSTGASLFFVVLYLHLFRGLMYGSYRKPRELIWLVGCFSFLCMIAEAFFGYLLPWGQMSYWGAQVIINLFSAIPGIGPDLALWVRGDYSVSDVTLNRFFAFHVVAVPLLLLLVVMLHLTTLRQVGSTNPDGIRLPDPVPERDPTTESLAYSVAETVVDDTLPFHPYFVLKDLLAAGVFLTIFAAIVFYAPTMGGYFLEANNFHVANPLVTPADISPVWYFTPFYAILRACTNHFKVVMMVLAAFWGLVRLLQTKSLLRHRVMWALVALVLVLLMSVTDAKLWGVVLMLSSVLVLFFLPWLDRSPVASIRYRPDGQRGLYLLFVLVFLGLGITGALPVSPWLNGVEQVLTVLYFGFFLGMPWWSKRGGFRQEPLRLTRSRAERRALRRGETP